MLTVLAHFFSQLTSGIIFLIVFIFLAYILSSLVLPFIPTNKKKYSVNSMVQKNVAFYIKSNGIHTDFVLPLKSEVYDWTEVLDMNDFDGIKNENTFITFGWGDKGFYMGISQWSDLTFKLAFHALCMPSQSVMHVNVIQKVPFDEKFLSTIKLSFENYKGLCEHIASYFKLENQRPIILSKQGYEENDNFYEANKKYHAFNTCNQWVNEGLKSQGVATPFWTAAAFGLFIHTNHSDNIFNKLFFQRNKSSNNLRHLSS